MKYKIGDMVRCAVEIFSNGKRKLSIVEPKKDSQIEIMSFPIVYVDNTMQLYKIIIEPDMTGWEISQFHINHYDIDPKFIGKKFYDITESLVVTKIIKL